MQRSPSLWHHRDYLLLWSGQVVSTIGSSASQVVYPLLILALTGSPTAAGIAGGARALPYLLFSLPVGALVDRLDSRRVMIGADLGRAVVVASIPVALAFDALTLIQLYVVAFVEGTLFVFFNVAEVSALSRVVPRGQFPEATAQNEAAFATAGVVGPSLGALLFQAVGRAVPFIADALSFGLSAVPIALLKTDFRKTDPVSRQRLGAEIAAGLRWMWNMPLIRTMALLTGGLNLVNAATPLIVIVIARHLGASAGEIGVVFSVEAVGGVVGSLVGGRIQRRFSFTQVIVGNLWAYAALFAAYAVASNIVVLGLVAGLICTLGPIYNVVQFSYRLALIPDALQGRVNSAFRLLAFGLIPVGAALSGWLFEHVGIAATLRIFTACCGALAVTATLNRAIRHARPFDVLTTVAADASRVRAT